MGSLMRKTTAPASPIGSYPLRELIFGEGWNFGALTKTMFRVLTVREIYHGPTLSFHQPWQENIKVQGSLLFVTYTIIQGIISSEMQVDRGRKNTA